MIHVTRTYLPPMDEFISHLQKAWDASWLTNRGQLVLDLERQLKKYLGVDFLTLTTNGTLPIQIAIKALELKGEIITTPFSYVATTSSIVWENCHPVFVDIHPEYLTIDETRIEDAITEKTSAILATHVFGNPCDVETIQKLAQKYNLSVIYDAAHCFGVEYKNQSIFNYGDISTCSFHATKIFHTGEGGCWVTKNEDLQKKLFYHHNFGHNGPEEFYGIGINAKMSELQAAMGLSVLNHIDEIFENRKRLVEQYEAQLNLPSLQKLKLREYTRWNYHYYPVIFNSEKKLLEVQNVLNREGIFPRRYFYPSLNRLPYTNDISMEISESVSKSVLCLPLFHDLAPEDIERICKLILSTL